MSVCLRCHHVSDRCRAKINSGKKNRINRNRTVFLVGCFLALLCLAQNANAQYATSLHREHAKLVDDRGLTLSDNEVLNLIGDDIYNETYVGAKKQCKAGRALIWSGAASTVAGVGMMMWGQELFTDSPYMHGLGTETQGQVGLALCLGGLLVTSLGSAALDVGIPLSIIGKRRLDWVADNYNSGTNLTCHFGATPHGLGLTLQFGAL